MKKVKFMFLSLALVSVVGAALAFKVKQGNRFCTTWAIQTQAGGAFTCSDANGAAIKCDALLTSSTTGGTGTDYVCTTPEPQNGCAQQPNCQPTIQLTKAE